MTKYRRLAGQPIEASQWFEASVATGIFPRGVFYEPDIGFYVVTIHDQKTKIVDGDWILPEPDGKHFYPCKPDIFAKTYEPADTPEAITAAMTDALLRGTGAVRIGVVDLISPDDPAHPNQRTTRFLDDLEILINSHSIENGCDTPDFILAEFLTTTLMAFDAAVNRRRGWYKHEEKIAALEAQLEAEGAHTAAANEELDRIRAKATF